MLGGEFAEVFAVYQVVDGACADLTYAMAGGNPETAPSSEGLREQALQLLQLSAVLRLAAESYIEGTEDAAMRQRRKQLVDEVRAKYPNLPIAPRDTRDDG